MIGLVDVNKCYCSCEEIFQPGLRGLPVVVLTNNDGCVAARSKSAKALGIPGFEPYYKIAHLLKKHNVKVFSSNYELYGDISNRIMSTLTKEVGDIDIYSIDEAFIPCDGISDLYAYAESLKRIIWKEQRVGVGVGIGPNKTLAKLANHVAKNHRQGNDVCVLRTKDNWGWVLKRITVDTIWGIGKQLTKRLNEISIFTGEDLASMPPKKAKLRFGITLERTVRELNGEVCIALETAPQPKKQIVSSRSFGKKVSTLSELKRAVAHHVWIAAEKLRKQDSVAGGMQVWITTSQHSQNPFHNSQSTQISVPSNDSVGLTGLALKILKSIYKENYTYAKTGVALYNITEPRQADLFNPYSSPILMGVVDDINQKFGRYTVSNGFRSADNTWAMKREFLSPAYTTRWSDVPVIRC